MTPFGYAQATDVDDAITQRSSNGGSYIAGGTNLLDLMKENVAQPSALIDINRLETLTKITALPTGGIRLGALARNADTAYDPIVQKEFPLLNRAILAGASPQLRNMATNGGNLMQRTRCYYFYNPAMPCNKRTPGAGCAALQGHNRIHAILGQSDHCIAVFPSDMCVALAALDAQVAVEGSTGPRRVAFTDFHRLPGETPERDNNLGPDEIITAIEIPRNPFAGHSAYLKIRDRESFAFALVSVATAFEREGDKIKQARIALGGVAHKPWRVREAEESLVGKSATKENFQRAAQLLLAGARTYEHNGFKLPLAERAIVRNCLQAFAGTV